MLNQMFFLYLKSALSVRGSLVAFAFIFSGCFAAYNDDFSGPQKPDQAQDKAAPQGNRPSPKNTPPSNPLTESVTVLNLEGMSILQPSLKISPGLLDFGSVALAQTSDLTFTLENEGSALATGLSLQLTGEGFTQTSTNCMSSLAVGASCTATYRFAPSIDARYGATVAAVASNGGVGLSFLRGTGGSGPVSPPPVLELTTSSGFFQKTLVGTTSELSFVLRNSGGKKAENIDLSIYGSGFSLKESQCGSSLLASEDCEFTVRFSPPGSAVWKGTISVAAQEAYSITGLVSGEGDGGRPSYKIEPSNHAFSGLDLGAYAEKDFKVTNHGTAAGVSIHFGVLGSGYSIQSNDCPAIMPVHYECTVRLRFAPTSSGNYSGFYTVSSAGSDLSMAMLSGSGLSGSVASGIFSLSPQSVIFSDTESGLSSDQVITITNTGNARIDDLSIVLSGSGFAQTSTTCTSLLLEGENCTATMTFTPTFKGNYGGYVQLTASNASSATASLSGVGTSSSTLALSPGNHDFGAVSVGQDRSVSLVLQNTGSSASGVLAIISSDDQIFPVTSTDCEGVNLAAGASCQIVVGFTPNAGSVYSALIQANDTDGPSVVAGIKGQGVVPALGVTPSSYNYGSLVIGGQAEQNFTITNTAAVDASGLSVTVVGSAYSMSSNGCSSYSSNFSSGQSCLVQVRFSPPGTGSFSGFVVVSATGRDSVYSDLSGAGAPVADLHISPASIDFGTIFTSVGETRNFILNNTGGVSASDIQVSLSDSTHYSLNNGCGSSLGGSLSCTIGLEYHPQNESSHPVTMSLSYFNGAVSRDLSVTASGVGRFPPVLTLDSVSHSFGTITMGSIRRHRVTLSNSGTGYASGVEISSSDLSFDVGQNNCEAVLLAGASCTFDIEFAPATLIGLSGEVITVSYNEQEVLSAPDLEVALSGLAANGQSWNFVSSNYNIGQIHFFNSNEGILTSGAGMIRRTDDGGVTWRPGGTSSHRDLYGISFLDQEVGFVTGSNYNYWESVNSGWHWVHRGSTTSNILELHCPSESTCVGGSDGTRIFRTSNGGATWTSVSSTVHNGRTLSAPDENNIFAAGDTSISGSHDGGVSFYPQAGDWAMNQIWATSTTTAWAVGNYGRVRHTSDAGQTWQSLPFPVSDNLNGIACADDLTCWAGGSGNKIFKTTDGAETWVEQFSSNRTFNRLWAVDYDLVFAVDTGGRMYRTQNGGTNWAWVGVNTPWQQYPIQDISCISALTCFVTYDRGPGGGIIRTDDAGSTWVEVVGSSDLEQVSTVGDHIWTVGFSGWIKKSSDAGATWSFSRAPSHANLRGVYFVDAGAGALHGWISTDSGIVYKSTDGGESWTQQTLPSGVGTATLNRIFFADKDKGWIVGSSNKILHTADGGTTWVEQSSPIASSTFNDVSCVWESVSEDWHCLIVGNSGRWLRSVDGGTNWVAATSAPTSVSVYGVHMIDDQLAYAVGYFNASGSLAKTTDGGVSWSYAGAGPNYGSTYGISFASNGLNGWMLAPNDIRYTTNGGSSWTLATIEDSPFSSNNTSRAFRSVSVLNEADPDAIEIVATTAQGAIFISVDSGINWRHLNVGNVDSLYGITFTPDGQTGFAVGGGTKSFLLKTTDAGDTWTPSLTGLACRLVAVAAFNALDVLATTNCANTVYVSSDGGINWSSLVLSPAWGALGRYIEVLDYDLGIALSAESFGMMRTVYDFGRTSPDWVRSSFERMNWVNGIHFVNADLGWTAGRYGQIYHTSDGGQTWNYQASNVASELFAIHFFDENNGFAVGQSGAVTRTVDGGVTWVAQTTDLPTDRTWHFRKVKMTDAQTAVATTSDGNIARLTNGNEWADVSSGPPPTRNVNKVQALDRETVYAVTDGGYFTKTTDRGDLWKTVKVDDGFSGHLLHLSFVSKNVGWVVGQTGRVYKTTDAGETWSQQTVPAGIATTQWNRVSFFDQNIGWVVGASGRIIATTDGGATWSQQSHSLGTHVLHGVEALSDSKAIIVGASGVVLRTSDGGANWAGATSVGGTTGTWHAVSFVGELHGWIVGASGRVAVTENGGDTWTLQTSPYTNRTLFDIFALDENNVWAVYSSGYMMRTTNGGSTWSARDYSLGMSSGDLLGVNFADPVNGWAVGVLGRIMRTTNGG
jgi:photosystem II stability/assembly factor-like uncharacterized protein